ncbi:MAG TPA: 16S rRNA (guanine(527)-N(7))-methyltransferase RsmG [Reyranella sp.]|nr:16S rRNA (guanine(527)-N(7))-methyltransferase RsmG [Reyranella sp.]
MSAAARRRVGELPGVSRETLGRLDALVEILAKWQKTINLIGKTTMDEVWTRHILDSAQLFPLVPGEAKSLTDLGSGAGFPGLVLAALRPDLDVILVEADARKAAFLGEAGRKMGLPKQPKLLVGRMESLKAPKADVVTARALAPLAKLLAWAEPYRAEGGICLFHKGAGWQAEVEDAKDSWEISAEPFPSLTDRDSVLLRIDAFRAKDLRDRQPEGRRR